MGKPSDFERIPRDLYPTPAKAVQPLIPYLRAAGIGSFAEPCCGNGNLVQHLEGYGLSCAYRGDIATGQDALASDHYGDIDAVITNPPHSREVMHPMITHFQRIAPMAWLLIDLDWIATLQAVPFLPRCSDVVIIGRVKWFPDFEHGSKDNFGWFRFAADHRGVTAIHNTRSKQRASVTPAPGEGFRYLHAEVPRMAAEGWERLPALDGTHHGEYSALMRRVEHGAATSTLEAIRGAGQRERGMSTELARGQRRRMKKLAKFADRATEADRLYFERFPRRQQHRTRLSHRTEIEQAEIIDGEPMTTMPGCRWFTAVRNIVPGYRLCLFVPNLEGAETDLDEATAREVFEWVAEPYRDVEARLRKAAGKRP